MLKRWSGMLGDSPWESPGKYQAAKVGKGPAGATGPGARECYRKSIACILLHKSTLFRDEFYRNSEFYSMGYSLSSDQSHGAVKLQSTATQRSASSPSTGETSQQVCQALLG